MTIAIADFLELADSIAAQASLLSTAMGDGSSPGSPTTSGDGAVKNTQRIIALGNTYADAIEDLLGPFRDQVNQVISMPSAYDRFTASLKALNIHVAGINTFLTAQVERVSPDFKTAFEVLGLGALSAANTFSPYLSDMGVFTCTGSGAGSFVDGSAVDTDNYYAANLIMEFTTKGGATGKTVTVTLTKWDGTSEDKVIVWTGAESAGAVQDIGTHGSDMYTDVTNMSIAGGDNLDVFTIKSELERVTTL